MSPQVNDQVGEAISLDLGRNGQVPGYDLESIIQPVVSIRDYRVKLLNFRAGFTPDGIAATAIVFTLDCPPTESWRILYGEVGNAGTDALLVSSVVRPTGGGAGQKAYNPFARRIAALQAEVIIGAGVPVRNSTTDAQFVAEFVDIPSGAELIITLTSTAAPFDAAERSVGLQLVRLPPTKDWSARDFSSIVGPGS